MKITNNLPPDGVPIGPLVVNVELTEDETLPPVTVNVIGGKTLTVNRSQVLTTGSINFRMFDEAAPSGGVR